MKNINELKEQELKASAKLISIRNQISKFEKEELLPSFKKRYEGKYFKYRNCYSCPKNENDYWFVYIKITKVVQLNWMQGYTFQNDKSGKVSIEVEKSITESICTNAITKKEFDAAYRKMLKQINSTYTVGQAL